MTRKAQTNIEAELVGEGTMVTLDELCTCCCVEADWIIDLIEHGVIETSGQSRTDWLFTQVALVRVAKAKRLERDLSLNVPGVALALELLDEIDDLRVRLKSLESRR